MTKRIILMLCVLVALFAVLKLAAPGLSEEMWRLLGLAGRDSGFLEAFQTLEGGIPGVNETAELEAPEQTPAVPEALQYQVEEAVSAGESAPVPQLPEAVAAFLESQKAFADYGWPDNVDSSLQELPFDPCNPVTGCSSSGFGYRVHPIQNEVKFHYGTDFAANAGENVTAFADGTVLFAGSSDSFGNYITIDHGDGWTTLYAHCSYLYAHAGQTVTAGEKIALVGATGHVTGPHLHFELRHNGIYLNPEYYIHD